MDARVAAASMHPFGDLPCAAFACMDARVAAASMHPFAANTGF
jgi:hypothetical protein